MPGKRQDPFTTPTGNVTASTGSLDHWDSARGANHAPKKRCRECDSDCDSTSARKLNRAYDPDNLSIREFRLDTSSNRSTSDDCDSPVGHFGKAARDVRADQAKFSSALTSAAVGSVLRA